MKLLNLIVNEVAITKGNWQPIPSSDLKDLEDEIFGLISTAYAPIGGHPNYRTAADVTGAEKDADYEVIDLDDDPESDAVSVTKDKSAGKKFVAMGHDGSKAAKSSVIKHKTELLKKTGFYVEASGKLVDIFAAKGIEPIDDEDTVRAVLKGKEVEWLGDGKYKRSIGGQMHVKQLFGKPLT